MNTERPMSKRSPAKSRIGAAVAFVAAALLLAGCAHFQQPEKPRVNIAGISAKEIKPFEQVFAVDLRIMNPNERPLAVNGLVFTLEVNGQPFASGVSNEPFTIAPFASRIVTAEAITTLGSLLRQILQAQKSDLSVFTYRLSGHLHSETSPRRIPFDEQGEFRKSP
jgi:LEA14-like dessication related protein